MQNILVIFADEKTAEILTFCQLNQLPAVPTHLWLPTFSKLHFA